MVAEFRQEVKTEDAVLRMRHDHPKPSLDAGKLITSFFSWKNWRGNLCKRIALGRLSVERKSSSGWQVLWIEWKWVCA